VDFIASNRLINIRELFERHPLFPDTLSLRN